MLKRRKKIRIQLNEYEYRLIIEILIARRNELISEGRYTDAVDDAIRAVCR